MRCTYPSFSSKLILELYIDANLPYLGDLTALERSDMYWQQINWCFSRQREADKVIMDGLSERVCKDVFMGMWVLLSSCLHILVLVNMSRGNHKSADP